MSTDLPAGLPPARVAFYNDPKIRAVIYQAALIAIVAMLRLISKINAN